MKITEQEIKSVSALDFTKRYDYFIKRVADWESIWAMYNDELGYALNIDKSNKNYLFLFPNEAFTNLYIANDIDFRDFKATEIDINKFIDELSHKFISKNVDSAFVFPVPNGDGFNIEIKKLCEDIKNYIEENY